MQLLAMHMANELLTLPVAGVTLALGAGAVALAAKLASRKLSPEKLPLMGVMGAFVFAAQMINFTLPLMPGTSGHLGGGVLLAILLGPWAGIVAMAGILIVQCLLFQDGGLLALGCNIINMGVVPCLLGWGIYRAMLGRAVNVPAWRQYLSAYVACTIGVVAGASLVPVEASIAGVLRVPFGDFLGVMAGVHLLIGLVEGAITFAVLAYLRRVRPGYLGLAQPAGAGALSHKAVLASLLVTAGLLAGMVSWLASTHEDGLEWSVAQKYGQVQGAVDNNDPAVVAVSAVQARFSPLPDYSIRTAPQSEAQSPKETSADVQQASQWPNVSGWGSLAGLIGTAVTLTGLYACGRLLRRRDQLV